MRLQYSERMACNRQAIGFRGFAVYFFMLFAAGSLAAVAVTALSPEWAMYLHLAAYCALFSLLALTWLLLARILRPARPAPPESAPQKPVVLDGSNILYWNGGKPRIETVRAVVDHLKELEFSPGVVFDANAGYLVSDRYLHDRHLSHVLNLPESHVMVVDKGTPADPVILAVAQNMDARIVSNDRFRDWVDEYPEVLRDKPPIRGGYRSGRLWLNLKAA